MRRGDDHSATGQVIAHQVGQPFLRRRIERRGGLVEQPDRPWHGDKAGNRQPPALTGRQIGGGQDRRAGARSTASSAGSMARSGTQKFGPESQVFADRKRRLHRVLMAEIVRLFGNRACRAPLRRASSRPAAIRTRPAIIRSREDLPAPLRPVTTMASPGGQAEAHAAENLAPATVAGQFIGFELHHGCRGPLRGGGNGEHTARKTPIF